LDQTRGTFTLASLRKTSVDQGQGEERCEGLR
jgi:hypothetical protein